MKALHLLLFLALTAWAEGRRAAGEVAAAGATKCAPNEFYKPFDDSCMVCDPQCASPCEDKIGCTKCVAGYYTSREDPEWPNACKLCTIPNCLECRSDIYDAWPMQCVQCVAGYIQADNRKRCDPIPGAVEGNILTKPAVPATQPEGPARTPFVKPQPVYPTPGSAGEEPKPVYGPGYVLPTPGSSAVEPKPVSDPGYVLPMPMPGYPAVEPKPVTGPGFVYPTPVEPKPVTGPGFVYPTPVEPKPVTGPGFVYPTPGQPRPEPMAPMVLPPGYVMPQPLPMGEPQRPVPTKLPVPPRYPPVVPEKPAVVPERPAVIPPQPVVSSPKPEVSPETLTPGSCPVGSFRKKMDGSCMECDINCLPGQCGDNFGCKQCKDGYFTRSADPEWPFLCMLCDLPNCVKCIDNAYDAWPTFCEVCAPGYELSTDRKCVPAGKAGAVGGIVESKPEPLPEVEPEPLPYPRPGEEPKPVTANAGLILTPGVCPKGQFQKEHDRTCMQCDKYCEPGSCVDHAGCNQCKPGYYRSRRDLGWPFLCVECKAAVPGCAFCEDGVFDQLPVKCLECEAGYTAINNGFECVKAA